MDEWKQDSEYGWSHPTGWTIARYIVNGVPTFMLWHGGETQGKCNSLDEAKKRHVEIVGPQTRTDKSTLER